MAYEILSVKMYELDKKISRMQSRIQMSQSSEHDRIRAETEALRKECAEADAELSNRLRHSKSRMVAQLADTYAEIERLIQRTASEMEALDGGRGDAATVDEKILYAEYALDFAMQAADHALLASMEALDTYMYSEEGQQ